MKIGDHVHIGTNTVVEAATIGNHVEIGKNCVIVRVHFCPPPHTLYLTSAQGKFTIIKDCAKVADGTIVPPNTVIPALSSFAGSPGTLYRSFMRARVSYVRCLGRFVGELPESTQEIVEARTKQYYSRFQPLER
jgi:dynactin-5